MQFKYKVLDIVRGIKLGQVMTYKSVADAAGAPGASRAVGTIMKNNYDTTVPCHRVICSSGLVGEYNRGGPIYKAEILKSEGVIFSKKKVVI